MWNFNEVINRVYRPVLDLLVFFPFFVLVSNKTELNTNSYVPIAITYFTLSIVSKMNITSWRHFSFRNNVKTNIVLACSVIPVFYYSKNPYHYLSIFMFFSFITTSLRTIRKVQAKNEIVEKDKRVLIAGSSKEEVSLARTLCSKGYEVLGFVDKTDLGLYKCSYPVLGTYDELDRILIKSKVDIMVVDDDLSGDQLKHVMQVCFDSKVKLKKYSHKTRDNTWKMRPFDLHELLAREKVSVDLDSLAKELDGQVIMVTGAGGSIGSEVSRQLMNYKFEKLIILDNSEYNLFSIKKELVNKYPKIAEKIIAAMVDIKDYDSLEQTFAKYGPKFIYHAAAYKHVHLVEENPYSAVLNNILGTKNLLSLARKNKVDSFLLVSTDKAVNPTSVMGATKRVCELLVSSLSTIVNHGKYCSVRFGNVLGSSGSLIPILKDQISRGGPVTVTDPEMKRYFMSIPEAVTLVLKSASISKSGAINILKMGDEVKIVDVAKKLIYLSGYSEDSVPIIFTGKKPGEKLYEELYLCGNEMETEHPDIVSLPSGESSSLFDSEDKVFAFEKNVNQLISLSREQDEKALAILQQIINSSNRVVNEDTEFEVSLNKEVA